MCGAGKPLEGTTVRSCCKSTRSRENHAVQRNQSGADLYSIRNANPACRTKTLIFGAYQKKLKVVYQHQLEILGHRLNGTNNLNGTHSRLDNESAHYCQHKFSFEDRTTGRNTRYQPLSLNVGRLLSFSEHSTDGPESSRLTKRVTKINMRPHTNELKGEYTGSRRYQRTQNKS